MHCGRHRNRFCFLPDEVVERLARDALAEEWGTNRFVLKKYLAVQVPWSIEQGKFTCSDSQFYTTAGCLQTRYGTPLYLVFEKNKKEGVQPWCLVYAGANISAPQFPDMPILPDLPDLGRGLEVVMSHDHILSDQSNRVEFLKKAPSVAQMCAVAGAIHWSLCRELQIPYYYYGRMNYLVPLYLKSRENIAEGPDLIAPIQISETNLLVRTVLEPHMPYASARVAVKRHDQLPPWLLDAWKQYSQTATEEGIENPEKSNGRENT